MLGPFYILATLTLAEMAVTDPALYLSPSPPMKVGKETLPVECWWTKTKPSNTYEMSSLKATHVQDSTAKSTTTPAEVFVDAETFWPFASFKRQINIPLSFHLTGTYGGLEAPTSAISSSYSSLTGILRPLGGRGKSALAGSSYGSYWGDSGLRIYGGDTAPAWSGWGNGKWGHYGKG